MEEKEKEKLSEEEDIKRMKQEFDKMMKEKYGKDYQEVIEGNKKSGTLITANHAIEQGKEVYAIPGSIFSYNSEGTNELIKDGANLFTCTDDIIQTIDELSK